MDIKQFRKWAQRQLGHDGECTVNVELTNGQLDQALENAIDWWNTFNGLHKEAALNVASSQSIYDLTGVTPKVDEVVNVWMPDRLNLIDFRGLYPGFLDVNGIPYGLGIYQGANPRGTIVQLLDTIESSRRIYSADPDWEFYSYNAEDGSTVRELRVYPPPEDSGIAIYLYRIDPSDIKLRMFKQRDLHLIREWALADAKYMLGRIRGKYTGGLPAAGGDRTLDGDGLLLESREDKDRLQQLILDQDGPVMPLVG